MDVRKDGVLQKISKLLFHKTLWEGLFPDRSAMAVGARRDLRTVGPQTMAFMDQTLEKIMPLSEVVQDDFR